MHKICFTISFISCLYMFRAHVFVIRRSKLHYTASVIITPIGGRTATYRCDDTRACVIQFWPPDDEHMCSKHVEAWNKTYCKTKMLCIKLVKYWDKDTVHVSDGLCVHHREFKTVYTATGICLTDISLCFPWSSISYPLEGRQHCLCEKFLLLYVQSWTPGDERKDRPKHVQRHPKIKWIWYIGASGWF